VLPAASPFARHRDESLVGVMIMHHGTMTRLCFAVAQIEAFRDRDGSCACRVRTNRRGHRIPLSLGRLKADDIEQRAFATRHGAVRKSTVRSLESPEAGYPSHDLGTRKTSPEQRFHGRSPLW